MKKLSEIKGFIESLPITAEFTSGMNLKFGVCLSERAMRAIFFRLFCEINKIWIL